MTGTTHQASEVRRQFNGILDGLLASTGASRATLRIDMPEFTFHVDDPAGEALLPGVRSLQGQTALDQRALNTVRWMTEHGDCLIQEQCRGADPAPPDALMEIYGVQAQMLGPVLRDKHLTGWISVHENRTTRPWTDEDVDALKHAVAQVHALLDQVQQSPNQ